MIKTSALKLVAPHRRVVPRSNDRHLPRRRFLSLAGTAVLPSARRIAWAQAYRHVPYVSISSATSATFWASEVERTKACRP
jgi:hypothetical protein